MPPRHSISPGWAHVAAVCAAAALLFTLPPAVLAAPTTAKALYSQCLRDSDASNFEWEQCGLDYMARERQLLDNTWKLLLDGSTGQTRRDLINEQDAWTTFSTFACIFYANGDLGREGQVLDYPACVAAMFADRTRTLQSYRGIP